MASHGQHCSHGPKTTLKKSGSSLPLQPIFQNRIFQNYLNCIEKGQKEHTKCYMISNPTPKFTSQIRSVFEKNRPEPDFRSHIDLVFQLVYCVGGSLKNLCHFKMGGPENADVIRGSLNADRGGGGGKNLPKSC